MPAPDNQFGQRLATTLLQLKSTSPCRSLLKKKKDTLPIVPIFKTIFTTMTNDSDNLMPAALTDFVFDLFDSVTLSQMPEEQSKLYEIDFRELSQKYFANQAWPSPQSIASECNGDPLFLAVYRELTHRHWHAVSHPNIRDRLEGWQVYRELFEEMLDSTNFYLVPSWVFDILNEFVYQFQGFCQVRSAVYASARKQGLLNADGTRTEGSHNANQNLVDNLALLEKSKDVWDVESVFGILHRLGAIGFGKEGSEITPVYTYLSIFSAVARSRLECLLGDYSASLQALNPLSTYGSYVVPKDLEDYQGTIQLNVMEVFGSVMGARVSVAYHAGVSLLLLRRYKDAISILAEMCAVLQRGFKTGQLRKIAGGSEQLNKQYDRMLSLLALLTHICPSQSSGVEEAVIRAIREKHGSKLAAATSYEEWFQCPKFISADPSHGVFRQQIHRFLEEMNPVPAGRTLRSYLKLYTSVSIDKLAHLYGDSSADEVLALLMSFKLRMRQLERTGSSWNDSVYKTALDIHYYAEKDTVHINEGERTRRFENFFVSSILHDHEVRKEALSIDITL
jgi:translation initiation factor 3 subunit L